MEDKLVKGYLFCRFVIDSKLKTASSKYRLQVNEMVLVIALLTSAGKNSRAIWSVILGYKMLDEPWLGRSGLLLGSAN